MVKLILTLFFIWLPLFSFGQNSKPDNRNLATDIGKNPIQPTSRLGIAYTLSTPTSSYEELRHNFSLSTNFQLADKMSLGIDVPFVSFANPTFDDKKAKVTPGDTSIYLFANIFNTKDNAQQIGDSKNTFYGGMGGLLYATLPTGDSEAGTGIGMYSFIAAVTGSIFFQTPGGQTILAAGVAYHPVIDLDSGDFLSNSLAPVVFVRHIFPQHIFLSLGLFNDVDFVEKGRYEIKSLFEVGAPVYRRVMLNIRYLQHITGSKLIPEEASFEFSLNYIFA